MLTGTRQNQIYNDRIFPDTDLEAVDLDDHLCVATSVSVYQSPSTALVHPTEVWTQRWQPHTAHPIKQMFYRIRHPTEVWTQRWQPHTAHQMKQLFSKICISSHGTSTSISTSTSASARTSTSTNTSMSTSTCMNANTSTRDEAECAKREQLVVTGGSLLCNITSSAIIRTNTTVLLMSKSSLGRCLKQSIRNSQSPVTRPVPSN